MKLFVVKLYERHIDDQLLVFKNEDDALACCRKHMVDEERQKKHEHVQERLGQDNTFIHFFRCENCDDGPSARVDIVEVQ